MRAPKIQRKTKAEKEGGVALIIVLLALLVLSAVAMGMMYSANMETEINANYKDSLRTFYAARAGLMEARERMRSRTALTYIAPPNAMPGAGTCPSVASSGLCGIVYILNPDATGSPTLADIANASSMYYDDELCKEHFSGLSLTCGSNYSNFSNVAVGFASTSPFTGTSASIPYKWVRITLKQNNSTNSYCVNGSYNGSTCTNTGTQVCYSGISTATPAETLLTGYASCQAAVSATGDLYPVYVITTLAVTPTGARRIEQYEVASVNFPPVPSALTMAGSLANASFNTPSSSNFGINGIDTGICTGTNTIGCYPSTAPALNPPCTGGNNKPAEGLYNSPSQAYVQNALTAGGVKTNNFVGSTGIGTNSAGVITPAAALTSPSALDALVANIATSADTLIVGNATSNPTNFGTDSNPLVTVVEGDANFKGNSTTVPTGAGILVVTGNVTVNGDFSWDGLILVIGKGSYTVTGSGSGTITGAIFVAQTKDPTTGAELSTLGVPTVAYNGGGNGYFQYNSCWATGVSNPSFQVIAAREEMY